MSVSASPSFCFFDVSKENIYQRLKQRESDPKIIEERLNLYDQKFLSKPIETISNYQRIDANGPIKEVAGLLQECINTIINQATGETESNINFVLLGATRFLLCILNRECYNDMVSYDNVS